MRLNAEVKANLNDETDVYTAALVLAISDMEVVDATNERSRVYNNLRANPDFAKLLARCEWRIKAAKIDLILARRAFRKTQNKREKMT